MALEANEKVYQSDMQHITPVADAMIYGLGGDWIIDGLNITLGAGVVTISAGHALLSGRLYELSSQKTIDVSGLARPFYVGLQADLSQTNTATVNNQFTFIAKTDPPYGNLRAGDIQAFIAPWQVNPDGIVQRVMNYTYDLDFVPNLMNGFGDSNEDANSIHRVGKLVVMSIGLAKRKSNTATQFLQLPEQLRPKSRMFGVCAKNTGAPQGIIVYTNGQIMCYPKPPATDDPFRGQLSWFIN